MPHLSLKTLPLLFGAAFAALLASCKSGNVLDLPDDPPRAVVRDGVAITLRDQKLTLFKDGKMVKDYDISSSKFGVGSTNGSHHTPTGIHAVAKKVGEGQPSGMVFKACRPTGEVVPVDAAGRDPIVTRIIQIAGLEAMNRNSFSRRIYIHGTPEESKIGSPASYGCIRMRSSDVVDLFARVQRGTPVAIETCSQKQYMAAEENAGSPRIQIPKEIVAKLPTENITYRATRRWGRRSLSSSRRGLASRKSGPRLKTRSVTRSSGGSKSGNLVSRKK